MYLGRKKQKWDIPLRQLKSLIKSYKYNKIKTNLIQQQNLYVMVY
jgi:hypothetical protein